MYGELVENEREVELEAKVLLQRRFGKLRVAANVSGETELYYSDQRELVLNPSLGATYEVIAERCTSASIAGCAASTRGTRRPRCARSASGRHAYVGPAVMINFGRVWWAVGGYVRVTNVSHDLQPGEPYGPIYVRSMIGYDL